MSLKLEVLQELRPPSDMSCLLCGPQVRSSSSMQAGFEKALRFALPDFAW